MTNVKHHKYSLLFCIIVLTIFLNKCFSHLIETNCHHSNQIKSDLIIIWLYITLLATICLNEELYKYTIKDYSRYLKLNTSKILKHTRYTVCNCRCYRKKF